MQYGNTFNQKIYTFLPKPSFLTHFHSIPQFLLASSFRCIPVHGVCLLPRVRIFPPNQLPSNPGGRVYHNKKMLGQKVGLSSAYR